MRENRPIARLGLPLLLAVVLGSACVPTGASSSSADDTAASASIQAALDGNPDDATIAALRAYWPVLSTDENQYLMHLDWSNVTKDNAVNDPVFVKALRAIAAANGASDAGASSAADASPRALALHPSDFITLPGGSKSSDLYGTAVKLMKQCYGSATCNGPHCPAALLNAHLAVYGPIGSPIIQPGYADKGSWQCTVEFGKNSTQDAACDFRGFCHQSVLTFGNGAPKGGSYECQDPGWQPGPNPQNCTVPPYGPNNNGMDGGSSGSAGSNPCYTGPAVAPNPAPWVAACTNLNPRMTVPLICNDANPTFHLPAPTLPKGGNPATSCTVFHNNSGAGTQLGTVTGCDHENGLMVTCYCCPSGS